MRDLWLTEPAKEGVSTVAAFLQEPKHIDGKFLHVREVTVDSTTITPKELEDALFADEDFSHLHTAVIKSFVGRLFKTRSK